jgi:protein O-GlcNAc transferase
MNETSEPNRLFNEAVQAHQQGLLAQAENLYRQLLVFQPDNDNFRRLLGIVSSQQGKNAEAIVFLKEAVNLNPANPVFRMDLAEALRRGGNNSEAIECYYKALELAPGFAEAHFNLANELRMAGRLNEARYHYEEAIKNDPGHLPACYNLGNTLLDLGLFRSAQEAFKKVIGLKPDFAEAHNNIGVILKKFDQLDEAIGHYQQAINLRPGFTEAHRNLANAYEAQGKIEDARKHYLKIVESEPDNVLIRLQAESRSPVIPSGNKEIDDYRGRLLETLDKIAKTDFKIDLAKLNKAGGQPPSMLTYQGRDDLPLKLKYAEIFKNKFPAPIQKPEPVSPPEFSFSAVPFPQKQRPHIGFVVTSGHEGIFSKCMKGILNNLSGEEFRLTVVCSQPAADEIIRPFINNPAVEYLKIPNRFDQAVEVIRGAAFDILYYWEVGSDTTNYFLPYFSLAPVQCTSWGWPVTTAIPQMNYFISSEHLETPEAEQYYTEKLVRFRHLPVYFYRPVVPQPLKTRADLALEENFNLYFCSQNLRKVHPDFDRLAGEILRRDPQGIVLFVEDKQAHITGLLKKRIQASQPDVADRIRFIPVLPYEDFLSLTVNSDVILDTLYHNGATSTYDALAMGTPIVTLPWQFQIGRFTYAAYKQMGVNDCIAENEADYIAKAVKLGTNPAYRQEIKEKILANCAVLFEDKTAIEEMSAFFNSDFPD